MDETLAARDVETRLRTLASGLDATLPADATIVRKDYAAAMADVVLPLISLDAGASGVGLTSDGDRAGPPPDLEVVSLLGAGGMGAVYAARQRALARDVALKRPLSADAPAQVRGALLLEARVMGALEHPNIVPVHALGRDADGLPVLVMKRIEGVSFRALLQDPTHPFVNTPSARRDRGLAFHVDVLMQVANALAFAHSRGIVHRDVKPENVMIGSFGEVYLLDWGIAVRSAERTNQLVGTLAYMAPEMLVDPASADTRSDVFLLGATLHEVLTGHPPHAGERLDEVLRSILLGDPPTYPPTVPHDLAELAQRALARDPAARPADAAAFRDALDAYRVHRASRELADTATAVLAEVERGVEASPEALATQALGMRLAEARFGFSQSLREWPDNEAARAGLTRCLALSIRREVGGRNATAARALLAELPAPDAALEALVVELERALLATRSLEENAARDARERDASVSAGARLGLYAAIGIVGLTASIGGYLDERRTGLPMSMDDQLKLDFAVLAVFAVAFLVGHRKLLANRYNRERWVLWITTCVAIAANDVMLRTLGVHSWTATAVDFLLFSAVFTVGALLSDRSYFVIAATAAIASVTSAVEPSFSTPAATMALVVSVLFSMEHSRRSALRSAAAAPA